MLMYFGTQITGIVYNEVYSPLVQASGTPTVPNAVYTGICALAVLLLSFSLTAPRLRSEAENASKNWAITALAERGLTLTSEDLEKGGCRAEGGKV